MPNWGNVLQQTITGGIGAGMGLLLEGHNDRRQIRQQQKLQNMQIAGNKELTDYNYAKQLQMWKDTNFGAQKEQLKAAGLNPGLLYGMGGAGGAISGSSGGSVSGGNSPTGGGEIMGMMNQKMQLELLNAQKENIEADTRNKEATATKTAGVDTQLAKVNIDIAKIERDIKDQSSDEAAGYIRQQYEKALADVAIARNNREISDKTLQQTIEAVGVDLAGAYLRNKQIQAQTNLTNEQINEVIQSIKTQIKQLQQGDEHINIQKVRNELIKTGIWVGAGTQIVGDIVNLLKTPKKIGETITEVFDDGQGSKTISTRRN